MTPLLIHLGVFSHICAKALERLQRMPDEATNAAIYNLFLTNSHIFNTLLNNMSNLEGKCIEDSFVFVHYRIVGALITVDNLQQNCIGTLIRQSK